jgi:ribonuclease P protein component
VKRLGLPKGSRLIGRSAYVGKYQRAATGAPLDFRMRESAEVESRLGIVISRKAVALASRRNRLKRVIREWFRAHRPVMPPMNLVVRIRENCDTKLCLTALDALIENRQWPRV